jgi:hypothetical protein
MFMVRPRTETVTENAPAHPGDAIPFDALRRRSLEGTTMRVVHHLYFPDEVAARGAAELAEMLGWTLEALGAQPVPFPGWLLKVSQDAVLSVETFDVSRGIFEAMAREGAGTYAGWDVHPAPRHLQAAS